MRGSGNMEPELARRFDGAMSATVAVLSLVVALVSARPALALALSGLNGAGHAVYSRWGARSARGRFAPGVVRIAISAGGLVPFVWACGPDIPAWVVILPALIAGPLTCRPGRELRALFVLEGAVLFAHALAGASPSALVLAALTLGATSLVSLVGGRVLKDLIDEAQSAALAKSRFLANMSHELRTPLAGVIGLTELALAEPLAATPRELMTTAKSSAEHLLAILNDILDVSKIEADRLTLESVAFDCAAVVQQVGVMTRASARGKAIEVRASYEGTAWRHGDPVRLRQVLLNLAGNAVKFSSRGVVEISAVATGDRVRFSIHDEGIGISPVQLEALFQPFVQADASTTRRFGGTGLGLSICRSLVSAMGGELRVESTEGHGSTFSFEVPLTPGVERAPSIPPTRAIAGSTSGEHDAVAHDVPSPPPEPPDPASLPRVLRVLLAEDNPVNQLVLVRMLERAGHEVCAVADGDQALAALNAGQHFDVVLMDVQMPNRDGLDTARAIRASTSAPWASIPVIALTANAMADDRDACMQAGMNDYLMKPVSRAVLESALARASA
jgi:signal transduction histidine kinase/BarA-like signal transduction histidine kinase